VVQTDLAEKKKKEKEKENSSWKSFVVAKKNRCFLANRTAADCCT
jgi:hypothetical protein